MQIQQEKFYDFIFLHISNQPILKLLWDSDTNNYDKLIYKQSNKMKTFRIIGMALLAVMMCVNLASCNDDDDPVKNEDGIITNQKRLIAFRQESSSGSYVVRFTYDNAGKVVHVMDDDEPIYIAWTNNAINATSDENGINSYILADRLVQMIQEDNGNSQILSYDANGRLIELSDDAESYEYTWENNKLTKVKHTNKYTRKAYESEYTYSGKTCNGWFFNPHNYAWDELYHDNIFFAHPELVGLRLTELPDKIYYKNIDTGEYFNETFNETYYYERVYEETTEYTYTLDSDGYIANYICKETTVETYTSSFSDVNGDGIITDDERNVTQKHEYTDSDTYTFVWE